MKHTQHIMYQTNLDKKTELHYKEIQNMAMQHSIIQNYITSKTFKQRDTLF